MDYLTAKHAHMGFAYLTIIFFIIRFILFKFSSKFKQIKLFKILPHVIDTMLLALAIYLCYLLKIYPPQVDWLTAKVVGLLLYIAFGMIAIKRGSFIGLIAAVLTFAYILGVAKTHQVISWFALI